MCEERRVTPFDGAFDAYKARLRGMRPGGGGGGKAAGAH